MRITSDHANRRRLMRFTVWIQPDDFVGVPMNAKDKTAMLKWGRGTAETADRLRRLLAFADAVNAKD